MTYQLSIEDIQQLLDQEGLIKEIVHNGKWIYRIEDPNLLNKKINDLQYFSKAAKAGSLFICKGASFKEDYLLDVLKQGVEVFLSEKLYQPDQALGFIVTDVRKAMALLAKHFFDCPDEKLHLIGITATKGKTTTTYFAKDILEASYPGQVAFISGEEYSLDGKNYQASSLSTPESLELYRYMAQAFDQGIQYMVLELSSQAFMLDRSYGIDLDVGLFLNITEDHVSPDEHSSMDEYFYYKRQIFKQARTLILSDDLPHLDFLKAEAKDLADQLWVIGDQEDINYQPLSNHQFKLESKSLTDLDGLEVTLAMGGDFNMCNATAALIAGRLLKSDPKKGAQALASSRVPGRMEEYQLPNGALVLVDFAHNYASLKAVLDYAKDEYPERQTTVLIGSQSHRSHLRWEGIAKALSQYGDQVYLTADDPGYMTADEISQAIAKSISSDITIHIQGDRKTAVETALNQAQTNDLIILAGKGAETSQFVQGKNVPYEGDLQLLQAFIKEEKNNPSNQ